MHVEPGVAVEPAGGRGMLMGGVIVGNDVDVEIGRGLVIDGFEEGQPLLMARLPRRRPGARRQPGDQLALEIVERGKPGQRYRAARNHGSWYEYARSPMADLVGCAPAPDIGISRRSTAPAPCPVG